MSSFEEKTMKDRITIEGRDGAFGAYIARPKALPAPAVVVLQELFGVNADIRKTCDELAEQGLIAVAPDLFWRQEPGVDLSVTSEPDWQHGLRLYQAYDRDAGARDAKDTVDAVAKLPGCTGKVAVLGYCLGALMVFLTRKTSSFPSLRKPKSKRPLPANRTRQSTAIRVSTTPSPGIMGRTTMLRRQNSPTGGQGNFYISNCGDLRSLQAVRERLYSADSGDPSLLPRRLGHSYFL